MVLGQYSTSELIDIYGKPNQSGTYLTSIKTPFPFKLAWDLGTKVNKIRCHKLEADNLSNILQQLLDYYGLSKIQETQIDHSKHFIQRVIEMRSLKMRAAYGRMGVGLKDANEHFGARKPRLRS